MLVTSALRMSLGSVEDWGAPMRIVPSDEWLKITETHQHLGDPTIILRYAQTKHSRLISSKAYKLLSGRFLLPAVHNRHSSTNHINIIILSSSHCGHGGFLTLATINRPSIRLGF